MLEKTSRGRGAPGWVGVPSAETPLPDGSSPLSKGGQLFSSSSACLPRASSAAAYEDRDPSKREDPV